MSHSLDEVQSGKVGMCLTVWMRYSQGRSERADWLVEVLLYVQRNCRLIRDGSPGRPPRLSHSS